MENELKMAVSGEEMNSNRRGWARGRSYSASNTLWALFVAAFIILIDLWSIVLFGFAYGESLILVVFSLVIYFILILFLRSFNSSRVMVRADRINIPLQNKEEKEEFEKPFIIDDSVHADLEAAMGADYIGSIKNRTYHLRGCRLAKLIKPEFKLENTNVDFFKKRKFKACKTCLKKSKKRKK